MSGLAGRICRRAANGRRKRFYKPVQNVVVQMNIFEIIKRYHYRAAKLIALEFGSELPASVV